MADYTNLQKVYQAIKKMATSPTELEYATARARMIPEVVDPSLYAPSALARAALMRPAAQRGFSESLVSSRSPFATATIRPSDFLSRTPALDTPRDEAILRQLIPSIQKQKVKDLPLLWLEEYPNAIEAGYEGRHRMHAMQSLYGDDPVLLNLVKGDRFNMINSPYYSEPVREWAGDIQASPLELMSRQIMFGDRPIDLKPLWLGE